MKKAPTLSPDILHQIAELRATRPYDGRRVTLCESAGGWHWKGIQGICLFLADDRHYMVLLVEHDPKGHWPAGMEILAELDHETVPQFHAGD